MNQLEESRGCGLLMVGCLCSTISDPRSRRVLWVHRQSSMHIFLYQIVEDHLRRLGHTLPDPPVGTESQGERGETRKHLSQRQRRGLRKMICEIVRVSVERDNKADLSKPLWDIPPVSEARAFPRASAPRATCASWC